MFSGVYSLPFTEGGLKHLLGGWDVSGIVTFSDGIPFTPALNFDNANTGTTSRPDRIRDGTLSNPTIDRFFDTDAFVFPARYSFGNSGRNILYGPGTNMVNFALHRNFPIPLSETSKIEFRFEALLRNRPTRWAQLPCTRSVAISDRRAKCARRTLKLHGDPGSPDLWPVTVR